MNIMFLPNLSRYLEFMSLVWCIYAQSMAQSSHYVEARSIIPATVSATTALYVVHEWHVYGSLDGTFVPFADTLGSDCVSA